MKSDNISRVEIDSSGRLCVWPAATDFAYIYRAAMEVHWDEQGRFLYSPPPRAWSYTDWFAQIVAATKDEYGYDLRITSQTTWTNIDPALKEAICSLGTHPRA